MCPGRNRAVREKALSVFSLRQAVLPDYPSTQIPGEVSLSIAQVQALPEKLIQKAKHASGRIKTFWKLARYG